MRSLIGVALTGTGMLMIVVALFGAISEIGAVYGHLSADPLAEPERPEDELSGRMLRSLILGGLGVPVALTGVVLSGRGRRGRRSA
jgi:hypothetical protein